MAEGGKILLLGACAEITPRYSRSGPGVSLAATSAKCEVVFTQTIGIAPECLDFDYEWLAK